jgi:hypothetical protein
MIREIRFGVVCESVLDARLGPITRPRRGHRDASMLIPDHSRARTARQQPAPSTIMAAPYFLRPSCTPRMPSIATGKQRAPRRDDP